MTEIINLNSNPKVKKLEKTSNFFVTYSLPFGMPMPNRTYSLSSGSKYRFGFNTQEKDDEVYGAGNLMGAKFWEMDTRIGRRWNRDPESDDDISEYAVNGNNPIRYNDPDGDVFGIDNVVGALVGASVDYGFQVAGNIANNGFSASAFTDNIDKTSIVLSAGAGFLTSGISSSAIIAKGITKEAVKQVVKLEVKNLVVNTAESVGKQINTNYKKNGGDMKKAVRDVNGTQAITDGAIANIASNLPNVKNTKALEKNAKKLSNIASTGRPRVAQTARAVAASRKVLIADTKNEMVRESAENAGQNAKNSTSTQVYIATPPVNNFPSDNTRVAPLIH
jgi:hypothetical protein